jgi:hypothetical protein
MYDGVSSLAAGIAQSFPNAAMVAGYINGNYAWTQTDWDLFPHANHVTISITASENAGDVLDVEPGNATPEQTAGWIEQRKASGYYRPTIYCNAATIPAVRQGTGAYILGVDYDIWAADWTGSPHQVTAPGTPVAACSATQYDSTTSYDVSVVYDEGWPHRTAPATKPPAEPAGIEATAVTATSVALAWNGDANATSYRVRATYQGKLAAEQTTLVASTTVSGLDPDHTYTFHVAASNTAGSSAETDGPTVKTPKLSGTDRGGSCYSGAVNPSAPTLTSAVCASSVTGRGLPSRSRTGDASEYQDGITALPQKSRRRGSRTDQRSTGWSGSPV